MKHGIPLIAFLIVAAICGAVGYVAGVIRYVDLQDDLVRRGIKRVEVKPDGRRVAHWPPMDSNGNTAWPESWASSFPEFPPGAKFPSPK
jgi:hypothetical protein